MYEIRDPIHQTIEFSEREKSVIDHPVVQRLRHVRQLGMSFLVYPGANHDRFSHALGAMHLAGRVWDRISENSREVLSKIVSGADAGFIRELVRFAGLLHDVGHAPFSHVSERFMPPLGSLELPRDWFRDFDANRRATHEDYSVLLIASLAAGKGASLSGQEAQDIASLIHQDVVPSKRFLRRFRGAARSLHRLLHSLISGEIDCDRMDYLLRDAHHTGVAYGYYDIDHIIHNLGVTKTRGKGLALTIDSTAVRAFEDFLLARYHMFLQVYLHKTTLVFDRFLLEAIAAGEFGVAAPVTAGEFLDLRDSTLLEMIFSAAKDPRNRWCRRIVLRQPIKLILSVSGMGRERQLLAKIQKIFRRNKISFFRIDSRQYLSRMSATDIGRRGSSALLVRRKFLGDIVYDPIERYSSLLKKYNEAINITNLHVFPEHYRRAVRLLRGVVKQRQV